MEHASPSAEPELAQPEPIVPRRPDGDGAPGAASAPGGGSTAPAAEEPSEAAAQPPPEPPADPLGATTGELAYAILRAQCDLLRAHRPAVLHTDDAEALHQLRVDLRRLRAALRLFADALPARAAALRDRLGDYGSVLGTVRDLDVQAERVAGWSAAAAAAPATLALLAGVIDERRRQARRRAVAALGSRGAQRTWDSLARFIERGPPRRSSLARAAVAETAPGLLAQEHRRLLAIGDRLGPDASSEALHTLRIRCKRLRYGIEFFEPWYGKPARAYAKRVVQVQELLGEHQDAVVGAETLVSIGLDPGRPLPPGQLLTLGALAERLWTEARAAHRLLPNRYRRINGRRWRRLLRAMENARSD